MIASLHAVLGHAGSSLVYRARFGRSPLVVYRAGASPHRTASRIAGALAVAWGIAFVLSVYWPAWIESPAGRALVAIPSPIAWGIAIAGLALMLWSQLAMGRAFRIGQDDRDAPGELRRSGPHARCRNPIYVGSWLALAGMTAWHPSITLVVLCGAIAGAMHALVLAEERFLRERFGAAFVEYCRTTPRYGVRV
ncbi:MAG: isoprenylcysteine carboxylmethyltransferase family protein [Kofleriaceae bacterium]